MTNGVRLRCARKISNLTSNYLVLVTFNPVINSKLHNCDPVGLRGWHATHDDPTYPRTMVGPRKTQRPVPFDWIATTRPAVLARIERAHFWPEQYSFPAVRHPRPQIPLRAWEAQARHLIEIRTPK